MGALSRVKTAVGNIGRLGKYGAGRGARKMLGGAKKGGFAALKGYSQVASRVRGNPKTAAAIGAAGLAGAAGAAYLRRRKGKK